MKATITMLLVSLYVCGVLAASVVSTRGCPFYYNDDLSIVRMLMWPWILAAKAAADTICEIPIRPSPPGSSP